jgi:hypothetical protein
MSFVILISSSFCFLFIVLGTVRLVLCICMPHWMAWDGVMAGGFSEHIGSWNALNSIQMDEVSAKMADTLHSL